MRHSIDFGLLNAIEENDEKIAAELPKAALEELKKAAGGGRRPAGFLIDRVIEKLDPGTEFTVNDMYIMLHRGEKDVLVKMATLRSTLSTKARRDDSTIIIANKDAKHRIYRKK